MVNVDLNMNTYSKIRTFSLGLDLRVKARLFEEDDTCVTENIGNVRIIIIDI